MNLIKGLYYFLCFGLIVGLLGCDDESNTTTSTGVIVNELKSKWEKNAAKGDLDSTFALIIWNSENDIQREKKLIELAELGHEKSISTLYQAYVTGSMLGIKKDCNLARHWYDKLQKDSKQQADDIINLKIECPKTTNK